MNSMLLVKNRRALYENVLIKSYTAGIKLKGAEVKAIREKNVNFEGTYVQHIGSEVFVVNLYIGKYSKQSKDFNEYDARRSRTLLLNKKEISEILFELKQKGRTAIPLAIVLSHNKIKLEFAVVKGKKEFEKKQTAKDRQVLKDLEMEKRSYKLNYDEKKAR